MSKSNSPTFRCCRNQGFQVSFSNGWLISVQFGNWHYCSNKGKGATDLKSFMEQPLGDYESSDAEIAVLSPSGDFVKPDGFDGFEYDVKGFCNPDDFSRLVQWVASR